MNAASLSKIKLVSEPDEIIAQIKAGFSKARLSGRTETTFYHSATLPQELFVLTFWNSLEEVRESEQLVLSILVQAAQCSSQEVEHSIFRLDWDYRRLHLAPVASHFQLMTFPTHYSELKFHEIKYSNRKLKNSTEIVGVWFGHCVSGQPRVLSRIEWSNRIAQLDFVGWQVRRNAKQFRLEGIKVEYAVID